MNSARWREMLWGWPVLAPAPRYYDGPLASPEQLAVLDAFLLWVSGTCFLIILCFVVYYYVRKYMPIKKADHDGKEERGL